MKEFDPVCFKELDTDKTIRHDKYKGREFYFDSDDCQRRFERMPEVYYNLST